MWTRRTLLACGAAAVANAARADDYGQALARCWGGPIDPVSAHGRARREAARLLDRADALLRGQGLRRGTVAERLRGLAEDDRWLYSDDDAGRARAVAGMNDHLAKLRPRLARAFGDLPIPTPQVRRMSPSDEAAGRGGYREPPAYYVDLRAIRERPAWSLPSVAFHETVPGHALQAAMEGKDVDPQRRRSAAAFSEAWATYAEQLAFDLGAYAGDPLGEIGYLQWRLFRIGRIVVDTGLGALGWSDGQAVATLRDLQGRSIAFVTIEADVARMRASPGVYAAQGMGALEIARLRPRRTAAWPRFHRAILADGPWPCAMLAVTAGRKGSGR